MLEKWMARRDRTLAALVSLAQLARDSGVPGLAARVDAEVVRKLEQNRFHLVVVGEFNHGKTTFVNALLGAAVLPSGVTPTTAVIHQLQYAEQPSAAVVRRDDTRSEIPFDELSGYRAGGEREGAEVARIEVGYPAPLLRDGVVLVDTPGVNDLSLTRAEITYGYIPQADAVLFVLDAGQPVKESERRFLQEQLIERSREKIIFVVAKSDIWTAEERTQALEYVRQQLGGLVKDPAVFALSAQHALEVGEEPELARLVGYLTQLLANQRGSILLDNAVGEGLRALSIFARGVEARRAAAALTAEQLASRIQHLEADLEGRGERIEARRMKIRQEAAAIKAWARRDLERFCDEVEAALPDQLGKASADDVRQYLGSFLENAFRRWAEKETAEIALALEKLADETLAVVRQDANEMGRRVEASIGTELKTPTIEVNTFVYDVSVFAVLTFGLSVVFANAMLGGLLIAAAPALAMWNRDRAEIEVRRRGAELGATALRSAAAKVAPKIDEHVDELVERLDAWVVATTKELHREVIEVLRRTRQQKLEGAAELESEVTACDAAALSAAAIQERLVALQSADR